MNNRKPTEPAGGLNLNDIYFVLFRHKWKIIALTLAGVLAAGGLYLYRPPLYESEAKLLIRYVLESKSPTQTGDPSQMKSPDGGGQNIINSEAEILTSLDLADKVVDVIGADKILARAGGGNDHDRAAALIRMNLLVEASQKSSVIRIVFSHRDPTIVQPVLRAIIDEYLKKHVEIHRGTGALGDFLTQETDQLRTELAQTDEELRKAKHQAGVVSLEDAKKANQDQSAKTRQELLATQAEYAEQQATLKAFAQLSPGAATTNAGASTTAPNPQLLAEYKADCDRLTALRKQEQERLVTYTEQNELVKEVRAQIQDVESCKTQLEAQNPGLVPAAAAALPATDSGDHAVPGTVRLAALESKIKILAAQLEELRTEATNMDETEPLINQLQLNKQLQEANFRSFSSSLEQSRIDEALGVGKITNISKVQEPSPPFQESGKFHKLLAAVLAGGFGGGVALAFLIELYLDGSVKRPKDIEKRLGLRLFLSIPDVGRNGHRRQSRPPANGAPRPEEAGDAAGSSEQKQVVRAETAAWDASHALHPYYEALCDRLLSYFEINNLNHKPKLVAVTGASRATGTSTIALGLAASLSKTGDGKVLLVSLNPGQAQTQQFYKGKPGCGLEEALKSETRDGALVEDNLYVVAEGSNGDKLPRVLPRRFADLMPRLKASDYDYIIFDMPTINQTSTTLRVVGFMDMVLLVAESEKTNREAVRRANALLTEAKANVSVVLNKTRDYIPQRLNHEY